MSSTADIREKGWTLEPFGRSEVDMAVYTKSAREVAELALEHADVKNMTNPPKGSNETGLLEKHRTKDGHDDGKVTLQVDLNNRAYASSIMPERNQPRELRRFWATHEMVMRAAILTSGEALSALGATSLADVMVGSAVPDRNVMIRTNWFRGAVAGRGESDGREILSGHSDRGPFTLHLYETHGGYLQGVPYYPDVAFAEETERRKEVTFSLDGLQPVEPEDGKAVVFLGAGWWYLPQNLVPQPIRELPALYHVATQPSPDKLTVAADSRLVTGGKPDRLSVVVFVDPPDHILKSGEYKDPPPEIARPLLSKVS